MRFALAFVALALVGCGSSKKRSTPPKPAPVPATFTLASGTWEAACWATSGETYAGRLGDLATFTVSSSGRLSGWAPVVMQLEVRPFDRYRGTDASDVYWLVLDIPGNDFGLIQDPATGDDSEWTLARVPLGAG